MQLISVIIPCYNASQFVGAAIDSVIKQTHTEWELILVNDGSTDNTEEIIFSYQDDRIRYILQDNKGQAAACNAGLQASKGDFVKFFDADDLLNPQHLAAQLDVIGNDESAVASCSWARFYTNDPLSAVFKDDFAVGIEKPIDWIQHALSQRYDMMPAWLWLIPRNLLEKAGGWDERLNLNNDFEFSVRILLHASHVRFAANAKLYYRSLQKASLSNKQSEKGYESAFLSARLGCSYILQRNNSPEMRRLCANKYLFWVYQLYPNYPQLLKKMEAEVQKLGGGNRKIGGQSKLLHLLQVLIGWKATKMTWLFFRRIGYTKWGLPIKRKVIALLSANELVKR